MSTLEEYVKGLDALKVKTVQTYYSPGARERAYNLAVMADRSYSFLKELFKAEADLALLVLNSDDWRKRTSLPYGVLFSDMGAIHLTADVETPAIRMLSPMFDNCPEALKKLLISTVGRKETPFTRAVQILFDHLVVHEFTHGFQEKTRTRFGAAWLSEFFADYSTYAFLKRFEAEYSKDLRVVMVVSRIMYEGGKPLVKHSSLEDFERLYSRVGFLNYVWYHGKFLLGVFELYDKYGESFISNLIKAFKVTDKTIAQKIGKSCKGFEKWFETWKHENQRAQIQSTHEGI
jgi:hypothetical protein